MRINESQDWVARQSHSRRTSVGAVSVERRAVDRRRRVWWSVLYGSFKPRRRRPPRRRDDPRYHAVDWHAAHLLAVATGILLLSVTDACLTLALLAQGAEEINPVMAFVVGRGAAMFAVAKMAMTGVSVVLLVFLARYRFMRRVRVELTLYAVLIAYLALIGYELRILANSGTALI